MGRDKKAHSERMQGYVWENRGRTPDGLNAQRVRVPLSAQMMKGDRWIGMMIVKMMEQLMRTDAMQKESEPRVDKPAADSKPHGRYPW